MGPFLLTLMRRAMTTINFGSKFVICGESSSKTLASWRIRRAMADSAIDDFIAV